MAEIAEEKQTDVCNAEMFDTDSLKSHQFSDCSDNSSSDSGASDSSDPEYFTERVSTVLRINKNKGMAYHINMAAKMLRVHSNIEVEGTGINTQIAVSLVLALKKRKLAIVRSINTGMDIRVNLMTRSNSNSARPVSMMRFRLSGGEFAEFISGKRQQKIVEIFEKNDSESTGHLSVEIVKSLELGVKFIASARKRRKSVEWLEGSKTKKKVLNLPDFIKYASVLINPLLREEIFESAVAALTE